MRRSLVIAVIANLALAGCMTPPATLDLSLGKRTEGQKYVVAIQPQDPVITVNRLHTWEVKVSSPDGLPVLHAHIAVDGGMPQHGHGLPTRPRVTRELGEGRYLLEGMKFSMTGWWVIKLRVDAEQGGTDTVTFNKVIELPRREKVQALSTDELALLRSLSLSGLPTLPDDPSNAWQSSVAAAALGKQFFFDVRFSRSRTISCASCHDPARQFQDGRPVSKGQGVGSRRSMPIVGAGYSPWLFWDGRKDSMWSQALGPLEDPLEHGGNRARYARLIQVHYAEAYAELFGPLPDLTDLPEDASPCGTALEQAAWQRMSATDQHAISRVFANMGKAIAAYERTLHHQPSRLDRYIEGAATLAQAERRGLRLFIGRGQCASCHNGPLLSDLQFHNTGVPPREGRLPDAGRSLAVAAVREDEFNCLGRFSEASSGQCQELRFLAEGESTAGAFRTPGLRGVATRPPYMHAGQFGTLEAVVRHYVDAPRAVLGQSELRHSHGKGRDPIRLSMSEQEDLVAFLQTL